MKKSIPRLILVLATLILTIGLKTYIFSSELVVSQKISRSSILKANKTSSNSADSCKINKSDFLLRLLKSSFFTNQQIIKKSQLLLKQRGFSHINQKIMEQVGGYPLLLIHQYFEKYNDQCQAWTEDKITHLDDRTEKTTNFQQNYNQKQFMDLFYQKSLAFLNLSSKSNNLSMSGLSITNFYFRQEIGKFSEENQRLRLTKQQKSQGSTPETALLSDSQNQNSNILVISAFFLIFLLFSKKQATNSKILSLQLLIKIFILGLVIFRVEGSTSSQVAGFHNQFLTIGTCKVDTSKSYGNTSAVWPLIFTISYPSTFVQVNTATVTFGLQQLGLYFSSDNSLHIYSQAANISASSFKLLIYSRYPSKIKKLTYCYLIVANYYTTLTNFRQVNCVITYNQPISKTKSTSNQNCSIGQDLTTTNISMASSFYGVDMDGTDSSNTVDFAGYTSSFLTTSVQTMNFHSIASTKQTSLNVVYKMLLIWDNRYPYTADFNFYFGQYISTTGPVSVPYTVQPGTFFPNIFRFKTDSSTYFEFQLSYPTSTTISVTCNYVPSGVYRKYQVFFFAMRGCPNAQPYYFDDTDLCYSSCPSNTALDPTNASCTNCPFDCLTCNIAMKCLSCSSASFRTLDTATSRCIPMPGYYENRIEQMMRQELTALIVCGRSHVVS